MAVEGGCKEGWRGVRVYVDERGYDNRSSGDTDLTVH